MGQLWKHGLGVIAVITGGALALMNVLGCVASFGDWRIQSVAAGVGFCADIGIVCLMLGFRDFRRKKRWLALVLAVPLWLAASGYTIVQGAKWLEHAFETAQQPIQKERLTEQQRQTKLNEEKALLREQNETELRGQNEKLRNNAKTLAAETRARIAELEKLNTFAPPEVKPAPIQSPFAGYEQWITFVLWFSSQACWFLAYGESEEPEEAEIGKPERSEISAGTEPGNDAPFSPKPLKRAGNGGRKSTGTKLGNTENVINFKKRPTRRRPSSMEEISALKESGKNWEEIAAHFGYTDRQFRNIRKEISGSEARQAAA